MDEEGFRKYMKKKRRSESSTDTCIKFTIIFEKYLNEHRDGKTLVTANPDDLEAYASWAKGEFRSINSHFWALTRTYEFLDIDEMRRKAKDLRVKEIEKKRKQKPILLKKITGLNTDEVELLSEHGIKNTADMIKVSKTKKERNLLSEKSGVSPSSLTEIVKLSDLTRIVDIKVMRCRFLYDSGYDTIERIANEDPEILFEKLASYNKETKMMRRNPTLVETTFWVTQAKSLPIIIEY
ncbi:MAG: DUF4332 domain-containing protein [Candidatus Thorarchaeota archaeon]|nr:DUF4332 domain-containing protein [Candidatus Thorarchaeota archaeon]